MANPVKAEPAYLSRDYARMWDLVRYQRSELMEAGLITLKEYMALVSEETLGKPGQGSPAPRRLESYDELRAKLTEQDDIIANLQAAVASEAQHAEDARRIAGEHVEARKMPTCATCASNGACLIQRYAASTCRDDVPDDQRFGCTLHEPVAPPPVPSPGEQK